MKVSIIGTGYVGLVSGVCFAELGHDVTCVDVLPEKVEKINNGISPIYEAELEEMLKRNLEAKRIRATLDLDCAVKDSELTFICVGTPSKEDGSTNLAYVESAAEGIRNALKEKDWHVVVVKSTVPPGTSEKVHEIIGERFGMGMNPEFLREGKAVEDFINPDRIVIGGNSKESIEKIKELYSSFDCPILETDLKTAEMIKYASNSLLATKISFANEVGNLCRKLGMDVYEVMKGVGMDRRLSPYFLNAGIGFGGSCFPKDVKSLIHTGKENGVEPKLLESVITINEGQPLKIVEMAKKVLGSLDGKDVAVLGLAFKPDSDDIREAPAIRIVEELVKLGATVHAYDPKAMENAKKVIKGEIEYCKSKEDALGKAEVAFLLTEWEEFKDEKLYEGKTVFDGRKVLNKKTSGNYYGICW
ncbi:UDP-glucose/GDP-mannose dehydrogenase family protein [Candidatus Micrarchaeota archaeon]|nr:UDP-glucose/GDP-mannose dehydrogenase family protein [Candidatus Micrarchaeota archaeon]